LAYQPFTRTETIRPRRAIGQTVAGDPPKPTLVALQRVETADPAAEHGHQTGDQPLPELGQ
jgi:hypothetical protein